MVWSVMGVRDPPPSTPVDRRVAAVAGRQYGVVSRTQLRASGLSDTAIRERIANGRLHRVHRGVYAVGHPALGAEGRALAAVLACGEGAVLSHESAAALWGLRRSDRSRVAVTTVSRRRAREQRIEIHRSRFLDPSDVACHRGVPVTAVSRTLVDLAGVVSEVALGRVLAQAEVLRLYDAAALRDVLSRSNGRRGARALRRALALPPTLTRSELEDRFLMLCRAHRIPRPLVNEEVAGLEVDFFWPSARLAVETDSRTYHLTGHAFERDRERDARLLLAGIRVLRLTDRRLLADPRQVARTLRDLLQRQA